jgi:hypothetical protein
VDLTRFVDFSSELEDSLSRRGLSSINVCKDANVTVFSEVCHSNLSRGGARLNRQPTLLSSLERDFFSFIQVLFRPFQKNKVTPKDKNWARIKN